MFNSDSQSSKLTENWIHSMYTQTILFASSMKTDKNNNVIIINGISSICLKI
jgi:hypothetical protein